MDLKQKYIEEGARPPFDLDEYFIEQLTHLDKEVAMKVLYLMTRNAKKLPSKDYWSQLVGGVVKGKKPFFFQLEFLKEPEDRIFFIDIEEIDSDTYLDYMNLKQIIK